MNKNIYGHSGTALIISAGAVFIFTGCGKEEKVPPVKKPDTTAIKPAPPKPELRIKYGIYATGDSAVVERFFETYTEHKREIMDSY